MNQLQTATMRAKARAGHEALEADGFDEADTDGTDEQNWGGEAFEAIFSGVQRRALADAARALFSAG